MFKQKQRLNRIPFFTPVRLKAVPLLVMPKRFLFIALCSLLFALPILYTRAGTPQRVQAATSDNINFQARLLTASGAIVTDGTYNVEFKLYDVGTGGTALWTETRLTTDVASLQVQVRSGYLSVYLGAKTAFPTTINWDQSIYLTMNIGGTGGSPSWDGEMTPRLKLTAVPYAFRAAQLARLTGTKTAVLQLASSFAQDTVITLPDPTAATATVCYQNDTSCGFATTGSGSFIKNQITQQTNANFNILSAEVTNVGALIQAANSATAPVLVLKNGTTPGAGSDLLQLQDSAGNVNAFFNSAGNQLTLGRIGASGTVTQGKLILADGTTDNFGLTIQVATLAASRVYSFPDSPGNATDTVCLFTLSNCAGGTLQTAYNASTGGTTPEIKLDTTRGVVNIQDANTSLGAAVDLFAVNGSNASGLGSTLFNVQGNGNVGIGVALPTNNLQIGNLTGVSTATPKTLSLGGTYSNTPGLNPKIKVYEDGSGAIGIGVSSNQLEFDVLNTTTDHVFYAGGNELMRVVGTGKVGIGTTGTTSATNLINKLHVFTATIADGISIDGTNSPALNFRNNNGTAGTAGAVKAYLGIASATNAWATGTSINDLIFRTEDNTNGNIHFITKGLASPLIVQTITRAGSVGIGTTTPNAKLNVIGDNQSTDSANAADTLVVVGGVGGHTSGIAAGGIGSAISLTGGKGGNGDGSSGQSTGKGGSITLRGGNSGDANFGASKAAGGDISLISGAAGAGSNRGGNGGTIYLTGAVGGTSDTGGTAGIGGTIFLQGGTAGATTNSGVRANGGLVSLQGGDGSSSSNGTGASNGGIIYVAGGIAGTGGGVAGDVKLGVTSGGSARGNIVIGAADTTAQLLILDTKNDATGNDPAGSVGAMYYNSFTHRFRCYQELGWKDCDVTNAGVFLSKNSADTSTASASLNNWVYAFTNSSLLASGVLKLDNGANATNSALVVTGGANLPSGQALIFASNTNASPSGNLIDLQSGSSPTSKFSISAAGVEQHVGGLAADITTGDATTATSLTIKPGTSSGNSSNGPALNLQGGNGSGITTVNGGAVAITGGNATGATGTRTGGNVTLDAGTGANANGALLLGATNDSVITLGKTTGISTINIGQSTSGQTINIGNATVATGNTQTINIGTLATGTGKNVITLGSSNGASSLNLLSGVNNSGNITVGTSDTNATLFVVDTKTDAEGALTGVPGAVYYNSSTNKFRCYEATAWTNCVSSSSTQTLQTVYTASTGGTTPEIKLDSTRGAVNIQDANTTIGSAVDLFAVNGSNSSGLGSTLFNVQGGGNVGIGVTTPTAVLHVVAPVNQTAGLNAKDALVVTGGAGGTAVANGANGGNGSLISLLTGVGGDANTNSLGGNGGNLLLQTERGGHATTGQTRGNGGNISILTGQGGGGNGGTGGNGGIITLQASNGSDLGSGTTGTAGTGGNVTVRAGSGGNNGVGAAANGGLAGTLTLLAGNAGDSNGGGGNSGGAISLTAGQGTANSSASGTKNGGAINITGGLAGDNSQGGNIVLNGGNSSTGGSTTVGNLLFQNNVLGKILIGTPCAVGTSCTGQDANVQQLVLDASSNASDPATGSSSNGAMYYSTNLNKFRCFENGAWKNCDTTGGTVTLQEAYTNSLSPATITEIDGKGIVIQGTPPIAQTVANGTNATTLLTATAAKGGNTSLAGGIGGIGGALSLTSGDGGNATGATGTGGAGGNITLQAGAGGTGPTAAGLPGNILLNTAGGNVLIGAANATAQLLFVDHSSTEPTAGAANAGAIYYNTSTGRLRCGEGTTWDNCLGAASTITMQQTYNNSTSSGTTPEVKLDSTRGALDVQDADATLGATANLLTVRASATGALGSVLLGVQGSGATTISGLRPATGVNAPAILTVTGAKGADGNATTTSPTIGGPISLTAGASGNNNSAATTPQKGGGITITSGAGSSSTLTANSGAGGDITLQGGAAGAGSPGTTGNVVMQTSGGNVGIGTASPSSILHIKQDIDNFNTGILIVENQSAGVNVAPQLRVKNGSADSDSAIFGLTGPGFVNGGTTHADAGYVIAHTGLTGGLSLEARAVGAGATIRFGTANSGGNALERMRIDNNGNVGIGTTNPSGLLSLGSSVSNAKLLLYDDGTAAYGFGMAANEMRSYYSSTATLGMTWGSFALGTNTYTEQMRLNTSGNVGIGTVGTSGPSAKLEVSTATGAAATDNLLLSNRANGVGTAANLNFGLGSTLAITGNIQSLSTASNASAMIFKTLNTGTLSERMRIDNFGNVGVGTDTTPDVLFEAHTDANLSTTIRVTNNTNAASATSIFEALSGTSTGYFMSAPDGYTTIPILADRLSMYAENNATGINLVARAAAGDLRVYTGGNATTNERMRIDNTGNVGIGTTTTTSARVVIQGSTSDNTAAGLNVTELTGVSRLYVRNDGNVGIGTTTPGSTLEVNGRSANVTSSILSGITSKWARLTVGRAVEEATLGVASIANDFSTSAVAGDTIMRSTGGSMIISGQTASAKILFTTGVTASDTVKVAIHSNGDVGIGTGTVTPGARLQVYKDSTAGSGNSFILDAYGIQSVSNPNYSVGIRGYPSYTAPSGLLGNLMGVQGVPVHAGTGTGTITNLIGVQGVPINDSTLPSGNISVGSSVAFWATAQNNSASTITSNIGLYVQGPTGTGPITNNYGILIGNTGGGINPAQNYAMVTDTAAGNIGFGTIAPSSWVRLQVKGTNNSAAGAGLDVTNSSNTSILYVRNDGRVGINDSDPGANLIVKGDYSVGGQPRAISYFYGAMSGASAQEFVGVDARPNYTKANDGSGIPGNYTLGAIHGTIGIPTNTNSGIITNAYGALGIPVNSSTGTIGTAWGTYGRVDNNSTGSITSAVGAGGWINNNGSGTITNAYALWAGGSTNAGTISNYYGAYIGAPTGGTINNKYGMVTDPNAGNVGIGDITPAYLLTVGNGDLFGVNSTGDLIFEGSSVDTNQFTITVANPTADRTYTIPNSTATTDTFCLLTLANCGSGGGVSSLQGAYDGSTSPATILTATGKNIRFTLPDVVTDTSFEISQAGTADSLRINDDGTYTDTTPFVIDSAGNVGIGTAGPQTKLEVVGDANTFIMRAPTASSYGSFRVYNDQNSSLRALEIGYGGSAYASSLVSNGIVGETAYITTTGAKALQFGTNNTYRLGIDSNGNVGIGTINPTSMLQVNGAIRLGTGSYFQAEPTQGYRFNDSADTTNLVHIWNTSGVAIGTTYAAGTDPGANNLVVQGSVGVGDSTPDFKFEIMASTGSYLGISNATDGDILSVTSAGELKVATTAAVGLSGAKFLVTSAEVTTALRVGNGTDGVSFNDGVATKLRLRGTARNDVTVALKPEFEGATFRADGTSNVGTMNSGFCSNEGSLSINTGVCGTGTDHSYYEWNHSETTAQDYDIIVRYKLPSNFDTGTMDVGTLNIFGWRTDTTNNSVLVTMFDDAGAQCGTTAGQEAGGSAGVWNSLSFSFTNNNAGCDSMGANEYVTFVFHMTADQNDTVRLGEIELTYKATY